MKRLLTAALAATLSLSAIAAAQDAGTSTPGRNATAKTKRRGGPVFRAVKEQIKQAQELLRQRAFYAGEPTGKLDEATREGLRKYQGAEGLKVTGTLNAATLLKMNITLTDKQKVWVAAHSRDSE